MPNMDLFGVGKDLKDPEQGGEGPAAPVAKPGGGKLWKGLLAADLLLILASIAALAQRTHHWQSQPKVEGSRAQALPSPEPAAAAPATASVEAAAGTEAKPASGPPPPAKAEMKKEVPKKPAAAAAAAPAAAAKPAAKPPESAKPPAASDAKAETPKAAKSPSPAEAAKAKKGRSTQKVTFSHSAPNAKEVHLIGKFLVSQGGSIPMFKEDSGAWEATLYLKVGQRYRYQFQVVDAKGEKSLTPVKDRDLPE